MSQKIHILGHLKSEISQSEFRTLSQCPAAPIILDGAAGRPHWRFAGGCVGKSPGAKAWAVHRQPFYIPPNRVKPKTPLVYASLLIE